MLHHLIAFGTVFLALLLSPRAVLATDINQTTTKENVELEVRWAVASMKNGGQIEQGNVRIAGYMTSEDENHFLLFVGATIRNNQKRVLSFHLSDFRTSCNAQKFTPSAYLAGTELFVATTKDVEFTLDPGTERKVGVRFFNLSKSCEKVELTFRDLPGVAFSTPPIE